MVVEAMAQTGKEPTFCMGNAAWGQRASRERVGVGDAQGQAAGSALRSRECLRER